MVGRMRRFLVGFAAAGVLLAAGTIGVAAGGNGQQLSLHDVGENVYSANVYGDSNSCAYRQLAIRYWINQDYEMANDWWQNWSGNGCTSISPLIVEYSGQNLTGNQFNQDRLSSGPPHSQSGDWWSCQVDHGSGCTTGQDSFG
jgi:hypothetical protein